MAGFRPLRSVELHILLTVVDRPRHGYGILQEAEARTDGRPVELRGEPLSPEPCLDW